MSIPTLDLVEEYTETYQHLHESVEGLSERQLVWKESAEKWSIKEVLAHLVDSSIVNSFRIRKILAEDNVVSPSFNQDAWVARSKSNEAPVEQILKVFQVILNSNILFFQRLSVEDWHRAGTNEQGKSVAIHEIFQGFIRHVKTHLAQIDRIKTSLPLLQ